MVSSPCTGDAVDKFIVPSESMSCAELELPCAGREQFTATVQFFERLGWIVVVVFPADDPRETALVGHDFRLRVSEVTASSKILGLKPLVAGIHEDRFASLPIPVEHFPSYPGMRILPWAATFTLSGLDMSSACLLLLVRLSRCVVLLWHHRCFGRRERQLLIPAQTQM
jgi:hypothetical protein